jgi:hypothetical protein
VDLNEPGERIIMAEKPAPSRRKSDKSTRQEMPEAYQTVAQQLEEKRAAELAPERQAEEKRAEEAVRVATAVEPEGIDREIGQLKSEVGKFLAGISERLGSESGRFGSVQKAVQSKELELKELYGIEKAAVTLAALLEAQNQKRDEFETDMARQREALQSEIAFLRSEWDKEKKTHEAGPATRGRLPKGPAHRRENRRRQLPIPFPGRPSETARRTRPQSRPRQTVGREYESIINRPLCGWTVFNSSRARPLSPRSIGGLATRAPMRYVL